MNVDLDFLHLTIKSNSDFRTRICLAKQDFRIDLKQTRIGIMAMSQFWGITFGSKCQVLKESRKGKFYAKGDEGIFLGYSCKSKAYRCLNFSTHKIIESAHVKVDEFVEKT